MLGEEEEYFMTYKNDMKVIFQCSYIRFIRTQLCLFHTCCLRRILAVLAPLCRDRPVAAETKDLSGPSQSPQGKP